MKQLTTAECKHITGAIKYNTFKDYSLLDISSDDSFTYFNGDLVISLNSSGLESFTLYNMDILGIGIKGTSPFDSSGISIGNVSITGSKAQSTLYTIYDSTMK